MRDIRYAIDEETGLFVSRVESEIAFFVLDYPNETYHIEKIDVFNWPSWDSLKWTKKLPKHMKNIHRRFWGLKLI